MLLDSLIQTFISIALYMSLGSVIGLPLLFLYPQSNKDRRSSIALIVLFNGIALNVILIALIIIYVVTGFI